MLITFGRDGHPLPGVAGAAAADGAHEVLGELVQYVAAVAHPHRPLHAELRQWHGVAGTPVAEHEATIPGIFAGYTRFVMMKMDKSGLTNCNKNFSG